MKIEKEIENWNLVIFNLILSKICCKLNERWVHGCPALPIKVVFTKQYENLNWISKLKMKIVLDLAAHPCQSTLLPWI